MNNAVNPSPEQIEALANAPLEGPIVMVNLLKYRNRAAYDAGRKEADENLTGQEAYQRYGMIAFQAVTAAGGAIVWGGRQALTVIGGAENAWDEVICVRYPSRQAFLAMIAQPEYLAGTYHRDAALERTALLCCSAGSVG